MNYKLASSPNHRYFMMPKSAEDGDLDPYEFRLLAHYYRIGQCWEGTRTTAKLCQMSHPTVIAKRRSLEQRGLIRTSPHDDTVLVEIIEEEK